jgi:hypothetical protein
MAKAGKPAARRWVMREAYWVEGEKEPGTTRMVGLVGDMVAVGFVWLVDGVGDGDYDGSCEWLEGVASLYTPCVECASF